MRVIVKAMSENGQQLDVREATLRAWRECFAKELRNQGVSAHASSTRVRGDSEQRMSDGRYRTVQRGASTLGQRPFARTGRPATDRSLVGGCVVVAEQLLLQRQLVYRFDDLRSGPQNRRTAVCKVSGGTRKYGGCHLTTTVNTDTLGRS